MGSLSDIARVGIDFSGFEYFQAKYPCWAPGPIAATFLSLCSTPTVRSLNSAPTYDCFLELLGARMNVAKANLVIEMPPAPVEEVMSPTIIPDILVDDVAQVIDAGLYADRAAAARGCFVGFVPDITNEGLINTISGYKHSVICDPESGMEYDIDFDEYVKKLTVPVMADDTAIYDVKTPANAFWMGRDPIMLMPAERSCVVHLPLDKPRFAGFPSRMENYKGRLVPCLLWNQTTDSPTDILRYCTTSLLEDRGAYYNKDAKFIRTEDCPYSRTNAHQSEFVAWPDAYQPWFLKDRLMALSYQWGHYDGYHCSSLPRIDPGEGRYRVDYSIASAIRNVCVLGEIKVEQCSRKHSIVDRDHEPHTVSPVGLGLLSEPYDVKGDIVTAITDQESVETLFQRTARALEAPRLVDAKPFVFAHPSMPYIRPSAEYDQASVRTLVANCPSHIFSANLSTTLMRDGRLMHREGKFFRAMARFFDIVDSVAVYWGHIAAGRVAGFPVQVIQAIFRHFVGYHEMREALRMEHLLPASTGPGQMVCPFRVIVVDSSIPQGTLNFQDKLFALSLPGITEVRLVSTPTIPLIANRQKHLCRGVSILLLRASHQAALALGTLAAATYCRRPNFKVAGLRKCALTVVNDGLTREVEHIPWSVSPRHDANFHRAHGNYWIDIANNDEIASMFAYVGVGAPMDPKYLLPVLNDRAPRLRARVVIDEFSASDDVCNPKCHDFDTAMHMDPESEGEEEDSDSSS